MKNNLYDSSKQVSKYNGTAFEAYEEELNNGTFELNKAYRIVGESSGDRSECVQIIRNGKVKLINIDNTSPDDDLKSIVGGFIVFDEKKSIIRIINEDKIREYEQK